MGGSTVYEDWATLAGIRMVRKDKTVDAMQCDGGDRNRLEFPVVVGG
jgi:hypothetical protein